ncbi:hypothetical protein [Bacillus xiapuensis]|uniref:hypothetical protein n=1 Tax=Bacillus xiapuensis TaxID=2014075 RepID=UPI001E4C3579|nr:hypothetical protein [Bacillus xiapuensis]
MKDSPLLEGSLDSKAIRIGKTAGLRAGANHEEQKNAATAHVKPCQKSRSRPAAEAIKASDLFS